MACPKKIDEVKFALCKIGVELPGGHGPCAMGSGCLVTVKKEDAEYLDVQAGDYLVTTSEVLEKENFTFGAKPTAEFLAMKSGTGELFLLNGHISDSSPAVVVGSAEREVEGMRVLLIPEEQLRDQRNFVKRRIWKSVLRSGRTLPCNSQTTNAEVNKDLVCYVFCDLPRESQPFHFRKYKVVLDDSCALLLQEPGSEIEVRASKDFRKEERPRGGAIINGAGEFVGVVSFREGKIAPVWISEAIKGMVIFFQLQFKRVFDILLSLESFLRRRS